MSTLVGSGSQQVTTGPPEVPPSVLGASLLSALQAAAASLAVVLVPVVAAWIATTGGATTWTDVVRLGVDLWVLAQHGGIVIPGGHVGMVPLGLTVVPLLACWYSGRRLARALDPHGERIAAGLSRARPAFPPMRALAVFAAAYALIVGIAAAVAGSDSARPIPGQAFLGAGVVATVAGGVGAGVYRVGTLRVALRRASRPLPAWVRDWLRPVGVALGLLLICSLVLLAGLLVVHRDRVITLHRALQPDLTGGVVLVLAQLLLLPNLVLWVASVIAGPGFAIGAGTSVTTSSVVLGPLPAVPVLGALPSPGAVPQAAGALVLLPVLAGMVVGRRLLPRAQPLWWRPLVDVVGVAVLLGATFTLLAWLSGGPAGPGRLAVTGPVAWRAGLALAAEVGTGALLTVVAGLAVPALARRGWDRFRGGPATRRDWDWDEPGPDD